MLLTVCTVLVMIKVTIHSLTSIIFYKVKVQVSI
jgi:hypothetical protein